MVLKQYYRDHLGVICRHDRDSYAIDRRAVDVRSIKPVDNEIWNTVLNHIESLQPVMLRAEHYLTSILISIKIKRQIYDIIIGQNISISKYNNIHPNIYRVICYTQYTHIKDYL